MSKINCDDVKGIYVGEQLFCVDHAPDGALDSADLEDLLLDKDIESSEDYYFCDECGERIL